MSWLSEAGGSGSVPRAVRLEVEEDEAEAPLLPHPPSLFRALTGSWLGALGDEPASVLLHTGFGGQLLSMRLGEAGVGLSLGKNKCKLLSQANPACCLHHAMTMLAANNDQKLGA